MRTYYPSETSRGSVLTESVSDQSQREIESAIRYLLTVSDKPAVFIESGWQTDGEAFAFTQETVCREAAENAGCFVITAVHGGCGGRTHMLFIAAHCGLLPTDCVSCM